MRIGIRTRGYGARVEARGVATRAGRPRRGVRRRGYFVFQGDLFVGAARATRADDAAARGVRDATVTSARRPGAG